jgi:hypothetical protein
MVRMIPGDYKKKTNFSEKKIFNALQGTGDRPDWIALHSLKIAHNDFALQGENDFTVMIPGQGIVVIEVKNAKSIDYKDGEWHLEGVPSPSKDPLEQADRSRANIRSYLRKFDDVDDIPMARLLWFPSIGRHQLDARRDSSMQFHEWEMAWLDDVAQPTQLLEKVLSNFMRDYGSIPGMSFDPADFTAERATRLADELFGAMHAEQTPEDRRRDRKAHSQDMLDEQLTYLDLVETNEHIYFDGAAGTGKSFMLTESAKRLAKQGKRVLVTCWNLMMAEELGLYAGHPQISAKNFNQVMLDITGKKNPACADSTWYKHDLPKLALKALADKPSLTEFDAVCVDEFQDIAETPELMQVLFALVKGGTSRASRIVLAGDKNQQIMAEGEKVDPFERAKELIPDLMRVRLRTNCRNATKLGREIKRMTGLPAETELYRIGEDVRSGAASVRVSDAKQAQALRMTLEELLKEYAPSEIRVLSPFATQSMAYRIMHTESQSADERWLKKHLYLPGQPGQIRWRSIAKFKGLESDVVVITDVNDDAAEFITSTGKELNEVLYVGMTRARYQAVVIGSRAPRL